MIAFSDLIIRLETAKEGSRELDARIALAIGWTGPGFDATLKRVNRNILVRHADFAWVPHYTTSLDAALLIIPSGFVFMVQTDYGDMCRASVSRSPEGPFAEITQSDATTVPLALCAACLKGRQHAETQKGEASGHG